MKDITEAHTLRKQSQIKSLFICECAMSVGIVFIVEGAAVPPPGFSAIPAFLFTHLMGAKIKSMYSVTTHE